MKELNQNKQIIGIGISSKRIADIFRLFGKDQTPFQRQQATQGIGIGLSVSYRLAQGLTPEEFQDKPIQVQSEENKGSTFSFILKNQDNQAISQTLKDKDSSQLEEEEEEEEEEDDDKCSQQKVSSIKIISSPKRQVDDIHYDEQEENERQIKLNYEIYNKKDSLNEVSRIRENTLKSGKFNRWTSIKSEQNENIRGEDSEKNDLCQRIRSDIQVSQRDSHYNLLSKYFGEENDALKNFSSTHNLGSPYIEQISQKDITMQDYFSQTPRSDLSPGMYANSLIASPDLILTGKQTPLLGLSCQDLILQDFNGEMNKDMSSLSCSPANEIQEIKPSALQVGISGMDSSLIQSKEVLSSLDEFIQYNIQRKEERFQEEFGQILIVDDVQFNLIVLQNILKKYALKIDLAHDGQDAIKKVKDKYDKTGKTYKIIFMDIQMPIKDGFQATKEIQSFLSERLQYVPVIAASAFGDQHYKEQAKKVGMVGYLEKPLKISKIDKAFIKYVIK